MDMDIRGLTVKYREQSYMCISMHYDERTVYRNGFTFRDALYLTISVINQDGTFEVLTGFTDEFVFSKGSITEATDA